MQAGDRSAIRSRGFRALLALAGLAAMTGAASSPAMAWEWTSSGTMYRRLFVDGLYQPVTGDPYSSAYYNHPAYRNYPGGGYRYGPGGPVQPVDGVGCVPAEGYVEIHGRFKPRAIRCR